MGDGEKRLFTPFPVSVSYSGAAVPEISQVFDDNNIHETYATVGFLFFNDDRDLLKKSLSNCRAITINNSRRAGISLKWSGLPYTHLFF